MVTDRFFMDSRYAKSHKGKEVISIIVDNELWDAICIVSKVVDPLMRMLRIVDSNERPSIGYVYDGMYRTRLGIKKLFKNKKRLYKPYTNIIKLRWDRMLRRDIHVTTYFLNPAFQYDSGFSSKPEVQCGFLDVVESKASAFKLNKTALVEESRIFRDRGGSFSWELAIQTCKTTQPDEWWRTYGYNTPNLQKFAIKILSQTSTSFRMSYKKTSFDPIDYESIDKTDFWVFDDEEEDASLNYEEWEQTLYGEGSIPIGPGDHPTYYDFTEAAGDAGYADDDNYEDDLDISNFASGSGVQSQP
ncbi:uncharacterized protein LOC116141007 [Pistacia vera]|uniref:uncharacterized protein LOC116141007 n=1 Tax=Pistacia vera TaxID=55513 RepID=UPI0012636E8D|nr:uncharacterized protein LOC116141007 [Pistacia vera]